MTVSQLANLIYSFAATALTSGQTLIPATPLTGYTSLLEILLTQSILGNSATQVQIALEVSYDGGNTWLPGGGTTHNGNGGTSMGGQFSYSSVPTHVRGTITVTNGPILLGCSISVQ